MDEHIQLLRQRLQELRDEVRAINEDREFLKRANRTLVNKLEEENRSLRSQLAYAHSDAYRETVIWCANNPGCA